MSTQPEGFFHLVAGDRKVLCFQCSRCGCSYKDIGNNTVWCCGSKKTYDGKRVPEVKIPERRSYAVDLNTPTQIGRSIVGIV